MNLKSAFKLVLACSVFVSSLTVAAIREHTFSISGDNGETGTGSFTWDDGFVSNGDELELGDLLSLSIGISGGTVIGGSTNFSLSDCDDAILWDTPTFTGDINFWCDNGVNSLFGVAPNTNELNADEFDGTSTLTFAPVSTSAAASVPTMSAYGLVMTVLMLCVAAVRRLRVPSRQ